MKNSNVYFFAFSIFIFLFFPVQSSVAEIDAPEQVGNLEVRIGGIKKMKGTVEVAIYNSRRKWLKSGGAYFVKRIEVDDKDVVVKFENLPYGNYAICSYHDVNNNKDFDRNFLGIPKEPYAMTRKAKSKLRKPRFKEMAFTIDKPNYSIETFFKKF